MRAPYENMRIQRASHEHQVHDGMKHDEKHRHRQQRERQQDPGQPGRAAKMPI